MSTQILKTGICHICQIPVSLVGDNSPNPTNKGFHLWAVPQDGAFLLLFNLSKSEIKKFLHTLNILFALIRGSVIKKTERLNSYGAIGKSPLDEDKKYFIKGSDIT